MTAEQPLHRSARLRSSRRLIDPPPRLIKQKISSLRELTQENRNAKGARGIANLSTGIAIKCKRTHRESKEGAQTGMTVEIA
jgi:hypothetical protein